MTSSDFLLRYASVTTALFDHIEHDMLALSCAFIDEDEPLPSSMPENAAVLAPLSLGIPQT